MKLDVLNQKKEIIDNIEVPSGIFDVKLNNDAVFQVYQSMLSNRRQPLAHVKDRSEISGGGRKPWKQKGTGRARVGSTRSPIWRHGGVTFGPRLNEQNLKKAINQKMKQKALCMVISQKLREKELSVVDNFVLTNQKTKEANEILSNFLGSKINKNKNLIYVVLPKENKDLIRAFRNLPYVYATTDLSIDLITLLNYKNVVFLKDSITNFVQKINKN